MGIHKGERYLISSVDLGLRMVKNVQLLVTVEELSPHSDGLELSPGLPPGAFPSDDFFYLVNWFRTEYSAYPKGRAAVNTLSVFEGLVGRRVAVLVGG